VRQRADAANKTHQRPACTTTAWRPSRLLHSERANIVRLRNAGVTGDELLVRLLYDLELAEARLPAARACAVVHSAYSALAVMRSRLAVEPSAPPRKTAVDRRTCWSDGLCRLVSSQLRQTSSLSGCVQITADPKAKDWRLCC
jgi:hypothetical protein